MFSDKNVENVVDVFCDVASKTDGCNFCGKKNFWQKNLAKSYFFMKDDYRLIFKMLLSCGNNSIKLLFYEQGFIVSYEIFQLLWRDVYYAY